MACYLRLPVGLSRLAWSSCVARPVPESCRRRTALESWRLGSRTLPRARGIRADTWSPSSNAYADHQPECGSCFVYLLGTLSSEIARRQTAAPASLLAL